MSGLLLRGEETREGQKKGRERKETHRRDEVKLKERHGKETQVKANGTIMSRKQQQRMGSDSYCN